MNNQNEKQATKKITNGNKFIIIPDKLINRIYKELDTDNWKIGDYIRLEFYKDKNNSVICDQSRDCYSESQLEKKEQAKYN